MTAMIPRLLPGRDYMGVQRAVLDRLARAGRVLLRRRQQRPVVPQEGAWWWWWCVVVVVRVSSARRAYTRISPRRLPTKRHHRDSIRSIRFIPAETLGSYSGGLQCLETVFMNSSQVRRGPSPRLAPPPARVSLSASGLAARRAAVARGTPASK